MSRKKTSTALPSGSELTPKQQLFIAEYLDCLNAAKAARKAGYSEQTARQQGQRLLTNVDIAAAISKAMAERIMGADEAAMRLSEQARGTIEGFIATAEDGTPNGFSLADDRPLHLVKKVNVTDKGWSFEMYDAQAAIVNILKLHGKFIDRVALEGELQAALDKLRAKLSDADYAKVAAILTDSEPSS